MIEETQSVKLVMLGNSGVGKTSLINRWTSGSWQPNLKPTVGAVNILQHVSINQKDVQVFLWDTAGQEQFSTLAPLYVRSSSVVVITAAINESDSFQKLSHWVNLVKESCDSDTPLVLAVNKIDVQEAPAYSLEEIEYKYHNMFKSIYYVSAQTGENVEVMFTTASKYGYEYIKQKTSNDPIPTNIDVTADIKQTSSSGCCK